MGVVGRGRAALAGPNSDLVGARGTPARVPAPARSAIALYDRPGAARRHQPELVLRAGAAGRGGAEGYRGAHDLGSCQVRSQARRSATRDAEGEAADGVGLVSTGCACVTLPDPDLVGAGGGGRGGPAAARTA